MNILSKHFESAKIVRPKPGDLLVFKFSRKMRDKDYNESYEAIQKFMRTNYPEVKFLTSRELEDVFTVKAGDL